MCEFLKNHKKVVAIENNLFYIVFCYDACLAQLARATDS